MTNRFQCELNALRELVPSARKSAGEYKPLLTRREGSLVRTEIIDQAAQRNCDGNRTYSRGSCFRTREEAIFRAAEVKEFRIAECFVRASRHNVEIA